MQTIQHNPEVKVMNHEFLNSRGVLVLGFPLGSLCESWEPYVLRTSVRFGNFQFRAASSWNPLGQ